MPDRRPLPGWPGVMRPARAAEYLDVSQSTFREEIAPTLPAVHITVRITGYMRVDLDQWALARRGGEGATSPLTNPWHDD